MVDSTETPTPETSNVVRKVINWLRPAWPVVILLSTVVGIGWGVLVAIDTRIRAVVYDENYIRRIAAEVRPSVIFDSAGSILVDQGGMRYLDDMKIILRTEQGWTNFPSKIIVKPKQYLAHAPIITGLDMPEARAFAKRGEKFNWIYTVEYGPFPISDSPFRFRLEIIP